MHTHRLPNYLRTHRRRAGFTQAEIAALVGCRSGNRVSRYESAARLPRLRVALAFGVAFGVPVERLFAGMREDLGRRVKTRAMLMARRISREPDLPRAKEKLKALTAIGGRRAAHGDP